MLKHVSLKLYLCIFYRNSSFGRAAKIPQKCSVVIIGAGMAGLGAARELVAAGISDILILEGKQP